MISLPVTFKYFDKLKLYQNFLLINTLSEATKRQYWLYEKLILRWAYSEGHQHLGSPIGTDKLKHLFGIEGRVKEIVPKNISEEQLFKRINTEDGKNMLLPILGNLFAKGFADSVDVYSVGDKKGWVERIRINNKGFIMGEILSENLLKRYLKYELAGILFKLFTLLLIITVILAFIKQVKDLII
jgi:hypothetical protein